MNVAIKSMIMAIAVSGAGVFAGDMAGATTVAFNNIGPNGAYALESGLRVSREPMDTGRVSFTFEAMASGQIKNIALALAPSNPEARQVDVRLSLWGGNLALGNGSGFLEASTETVFNRRNSAKSYPLSSFPEFSASVTKGKTYTLLAALSGAQQSCDNSQDSFACDVTWYEALFPGEGAAGSAEYYLDLVNYDPDTALAVRVSLVPLPAPVFLLLGGLGLLGLASRRTVAI